MGLSLVVRGGTVYDGGGAPGVAADVLVAGDRVVDVGTAPAEHSGLVIDATGLAVTPGFVNVLSHAWPDLLVDGGAESELRQGVTTEVFGEADSPGPADRAYGDYLRDVYEASVTADFRRLGDGLDAIERGGVAPNVASFVGGANLRYLGAGFADRRLSGPELDRVGGVLAEELQDGALGLGTALIYPPGRYADTDELAALCEVVADHDGLYISHLRSEGDALLESLDELLTLNERTGVRAEVYHLKALGRRNWPKMRQAVERIALAREAGRPISADMYPYEAGGNPLYACVPPRFQDGGPEALAARLADPAQRREMAAALRTETAEFENLFLAAGGGSGVLLPRDLRDGTPARGRRLDAVAATLGMDDAEALLEVVARDPWISAVYFFVDPANLELGLRQPWVSIGSDASAHPASPPWSERGTHPRTYGTFARVLGHFCRDRKLFSFAEAVRRMTGLPAETLRLPGRGRLTPGSYADIVVLDPDAVADTATWDEPHRYALGVRDVVVNGVPALSGGMPTGVRPGRRLRRAGS
ncbi:amidohydrolase family protein [Sphaerimonospora mesophila]|uniref:N-acyl-D-amino-acid deacylase family protein n=1 Tax=Sphaerimonospora mesophila TaxID=37483 RepID=UPI0007C7F4DE